MNERMLDRTKQPTFEEMDDWIGQPIASDWLRLRQMLEEKYKE